MNLIKKSSQRSLLINDRTSFASSKMKLAIAISTMLCSQLGFSHSGIGSDAEGHLENMVKQSQLAFLGQVSKVAYRSEKIGERGSIPVTFVTYNIKKVIRGKAEDDKLTLRFLGGSDGKGGFLSLSNSPQFQAKETDIVLVSGNGSESCPLVNCQDGRFRVTRGGVFNSHGVPVKALTKEGVIARGNTDKSFLSFSYPAPTFEDLLKQPEAKARLEKLGLSRAEAKRKFEAEAPKEIIVKRVVVKKDKQAEQEAEKNNDGRAIISSEEPLQEGPIAMEEFMEHIVKLSNSVGSPSQTIRSLDFNRSLPIKLGPAQKPRDELITDTKKSEEEILSAERGGNPVIKR